MELSKMRWTKSELDKLVMNFLLVEGYKEAADAFARESTLPATTQSSLTTITTRTQLRQSILSGDCRGAISLLNDLNPDLLDGDHLLAARLHVQLLIEMVRGQKVDTGAVLTVAREQVAPVVLSAIKKAPNKQSAAEAELLLHDFNRCLAYLLVSGSAGAIPKPVQPVLEVGRRAAVAVAVNKAVLEGAGQESESVLPKLLQLQHVRVVE